MIEMITLLSEIKLLLLALIIIQGGAFILLLLTGYLEGKRDDNHRCKTDHRGDEPGSGDGSSSMDAGASMG